MLRGAWFISLALFACDRPEPERPQPVPLQYPGARRGDTVDTFPGVAVADPYRWLEDPEAAETRTWIDAENHLTESVFADIPERTRIRA
ncbi:MAG TPA: hypothetical protein VL172_06250, partial [Kofleriaceae bacterium]|nr:hypothetical protein [Kofleriaceae bacterium]